MTCATCGDALWLDSAPGAFDGAACPDCNPGVATVDENTGLPLGVPA